MNIPFETDIIAGLISWISAHGARVVLILAAAVLADYSLKKMIAKQAGLPVIGRLHDRMSGSQKKRVKTIFNVLAASFSFIIYVIATLMIFPEFGVNIAPILAGLGLVGLAVSMAAKDVLTDFISGFFILSEGQYNIGDKIKISDIDGTVKEITLRRTVIETEDGTWHFIPNREIKIVARKKHADEERRGNDYY
jgi:small conductance mechanosensitive channel